MKNVYPQINEENLKRFREHPYFEKSRKAILEKAEQFLVSDPTRIKFSDIHLYVVTGNRYLFENIYSEYQDRMQNLYGAYMITEDEKYLPALADIIWNICSFESWTIPAHISEGADLADRRCSLDLCSTLLGAALSEVLYFVGEKLPELVVRRAKANIRERIIDTFMSKKDEEIYWFHRNTNWSAVCTYGVSTCFFFLATDEEIESQIPRFLKSMDCYLSGLDDEGCCIEGYGYWNYGFGCFVRFALMLRAYTDSKIDLFKLDKVHVTALFQQNIAMNSHQCISFSDAGLVFAPGAWLSHTLKNEYEDVEIPAIEADDFHSSLIGKILLQDPDLANCVFKPKSHNFYNSQWFVYHGQKYSLGAKAGHNREIHNHNDVGSFIFSKDDEVSFVDPGAGEYCAGYFGNDALFVRSSRGHSVPMINGQCQMASENKADIFEQNERTFSFNMQKVYDVPTLKELRRTIDCKEDFATVTDVYTFTEKPQSVAERFVSLKPISVEGGRAICGNTVLEFDEKLFDAQVQSEIIDRSQGRKETGYVLNLSVKEPMAQMRFEFKIG